MQKLLNTRTGTGLIYGQFFSFALILLLFSLTVIFSGEYNQDSVFIEITLIEAWS